MTIELQQDEPLRHQETPTSEWILIDPLSDYETEASQINIKILESENFIIIAHIVVGGRAFLYVSVSEILDNQPRSVWVYWDWKTFGTVSLTQSDYTGDSGSYWDIFAYLDRLGYNQQSTQATQLQIQLQAAIDAARTEAGLPVNGDDE